MVEDKRRIVSIGEIVTRVAQLAPSELRQLPVGDQIWRFPESGSFNGYFYEVAWKSDRDRSGLYRLTVKGDQETRDQVISDFEIVLGKEHGARIRLSSGSDPIEDVLWNAEQVTRRLDLLRNCPLKS